MVDFNDQLPEQLLSWSRISSNHQQYPTNSPLPGPVAKRVHHRGVIRTDDLVSQCFQGWKKPIPRFSMYGYILYQSKHDFSGWWNFEHFCFFQFSPMKIDGKSWAIDEHIFSPIGWNGPTRRWLKRKTCLYWINQEAHLRKIWPYLLGEIHRMLKYGDIIAKDIFLLQASWDIQEHILIWACFFS